MKGLLVYAVLAVLTTALAAVVFHAFRDVSTDVDDLQAGGGVSRDEVRAVVDEVFEDHVEKRLRGEDSTAAVVAGRIDAAIADLVRGQKELMTRLDALANADPAAAALDPDYEIPEAARIEEIVAQSIAREEERARRERQERVEREMAERAEAQRARTVERISASLELRSDQRAVLDRILADGDTKRREMFTQLRENRESGQEGGWRDMSTAFEQMNAAAEESLVAVLDTRQQELWTDYKKENPFALSGMGGMRFARGGGRGGGRGGQTDGEGDE